MPPAFHLWGPFAGIRSGTRLNTQQHSYEETFGRFRRHAERVRRCVRWVSRGFTGVPHQILVEVRWRLGDEIMAIPMYEAIKTRWPGAYLHVLCNYPDLLDGNPFVDSVNSPPERPDCYWLLRGAPRTVNRLTHYARVVDIPRPSTLPTMYFTDSQEDLLPDVERPLVAVARGASWATKRWPLDKWFALCSALVDEGVNIVELGVAGEEIGVGHSLTGTTSVRDAACVLRRCDLLICSDSGLMHLALASGTPVLAIFGPTTPEILIENNPLLHVIENGRPCFGCWNRSLAMRKEGECPLGIPECLDTIRADSVVRQALSLLRRA